MASVPRPSFAIKPPKKFVITILCLIVKQKMDMPANSGAALISIQNRPETRKERSLLMYIGKTCQRNRVTNAMWKILNFLPLSFLSRCRLSSRAAAGRLVGYSILLGYTSVDLRRPATPYPNICVDKVKKKPITAEGLML